MENISTLGVTSTTSSTQHWKGELTVWFVAFSTLISTGISHAASAYPESSVAAPSAIRQVIGNPPVGPLTEPAAHKSYRVFESLQKRALVEGRVQVIVGLRVGFAAERLLALDDVAVQRDEISIAQSSVLERIMPAAREGVDHKRFKYIPFMAMAVNATQLVALAGHPDVTSIEEDSLAKPSLSQSVPHIGGVSAWASGYTGAGQTVAILDTGVEKNHPFLAGKVVSEACYSSNLCPGGATQTTAVGSAAPCAGLCSHGTHVAGIAAGRGVAFSGVAKDATIIAIQVFHRTDNPAECSKSAPPCVVASVSDILLGLQRVYELTSSFAIAAVNLSLGSNPSKVSGFGDQASCNAAGGGYVGAFANLRSAGVAPVVASGNDGFLDSMSSPGCISNAISVGATFTSTSSVPPDGLAYFSNSAPFLSLLAPGYPVNSSVPGGAFEYDSGTSMATPHVVGAFALLKQKRPWLTVDSGLIALASTGVEIRDGRNGIVTPRIQLDDALNSIPAHTTITSLSACSGHGGVEGVRGWGPEAYPCWGVASWGAHNQLGRSLPLNLCKCTGHGGVEGVALWGPQGDACGGVGGTWGTYNAACADMQSTDICACTGHGGVEGLTMWGPAGSACGGIASWGAHNQTCHSIRALGALPQAPEIGALTAGNNRLYVGFTPGNLGGGSLSTYTADCQGIIGVGSSSPIIVKGVTAGGTYRCDVVASTTVGVSGRSLASNSATVHTQLASCTGHGGVEGVRAWGPEYSSCWGVGASWGAYSLSPRRLPGNLCKCTGHGGVEGVSLWGPQSDACGGIASWGTYSQSCVDMQSTSICACTGHGGVEGLTMWGPAGAACGGIAAWGTHNQSCYLSFRVPDARRPLDIDYDLFDTVKYRAGTDGTLLLRYLFGMRGTALTQDASGSNAYRSAPEHVSEYLESIMAALDIDRNGRIDPTTDGLLILRYLLGLRGDPLLRGALGGNAARRTASEVENYIRTLIP